MKWPIPRGRHRGPSPAELRRYTAHLEHRLAAAHYQLSELRLDLQAAHTEIQRLQDLAPAPPVTVVVRSGPLHPSHVWAPHPRQPPGRDNGNDTTQQLPLPTRHHVA